MDIEKIRNYLSSGKNFFDVNLRVCIYARVSTDCVEQKKSLINQVEYFKDYISLNKNWIYVCSYVDDGISGTSDIKRNCFMKMIEDARHGLFDLIITKEISRFSRNTLDSIKYTRLLLSYGVGVFFVSDNINTVYSDSELRLTIMSSLAQDEVRRISERVKFGMNRAIMRGDILGNDMLYGYKKNKENGCLFIIENEAKIVKEIFELYVYKKYSLGKISKHLNSKTDKKWYSTSISRIIENPKYKGYYCGKKSTVVDYITKKVEKISKEEWIIHKDCGKIPPIVDENLWKLANIRLVERKIKKTNKISYQDRYLYSGKIFCGNDNSLYYRKKNSDILWICSKALNFGKKACNLFYLSEDIINHIFNDLLEIFNINYNDLIMYLENLYNECFSVSAKLYELINKKVSLYRKKDKLVDLNISEIISKDEFLKKKRMLDDELIVVDNSIFSLFNYNNYFSFNKFNINLEEFFFEKVVSFLLNKVVVFNERDRIVFNVFLNYNFEFFSKDYLIYDILYNVNFYSYK